MAKQSKLKRARTAKPAMKPAKKAMSVKRAAPKVKGRPKTKAKPKVVARASKPARPLVKKSSAKKAVKKVLKVVLRKVAAVTSRGKIGASKKPAAKVAAKPVKAAVKPAAASSKAADRQTKSKTKNLGMPISKVNTKEVLPGGGIVLPATKSTPAMRLRADDAAILATAKERYGTKDLEQFRKLILEQQHESREEFDILSQNILDTSGEFEADNQAYSLHTAEQGTDAIEREKTFLHAQRTSDYIKKLDETLERIDRGTYGICVICGGLIEKQRLQAVPITQKHVDCKNRTNARRPAESGQRETEEPTPNVE